MTLQEARTVWLTMVGSDWVGLIDMLTENRELIWEAYTVLRLENSLDTHISSNKVKITCKS